MVAHPALAALAAGPVSHRANVVAGRRGRRRSLWGTVPPARPGRNRCRRRIVPPPGPPPPGTDARTERYRPSRQRI